MRGVGYCLYIHHSCFVFGFESFKQQADSASFGLVPGAAS